MLTPTAIDIEAAYIFACECQAALSVFIESDAVQLFESIHRTLRACPDSLSAIYMAPTAMTVVGFGRQVLRRHRVAGRDYTPVSRSTRERVCQALERVLMWHAQPSLTLNEIARAVGVGPRYLSEHLNEISARDFLSHLHAIRVLHAAIVLAETRMSIESIAHAVGYLCTPQLHKHFQRLLHATPSRFRTVVTANANSR